MPETEFARLIRQAQPHVPVVQAAWNRIAACLGLHVGNPLIFERGWAALHRVEGERLLERTAL